MTAAGVFDPRSLIAVLNRHEVRYVVIGGIAAGVQGAIWATFDLDICYDRSLANLDRLAAALADVEARPVGLPLGVAAQLDARSLRAGDWWTLDTRLGRLDLLGQPAPGIGYDTLVATARTFSGAERYLVASIDDLIRMKAAANRPKDRLQLDLLKAVSEESKRKA